MGAATTAVAKCFPDRDYAQLPMAAEKIFDGMMVCGNASGYAAKAADTASFTFQGIADETVDNSGGSAGDLNITVYRGPFEVTSVETETAASIGALRYVATNCEVGAAGTQTNDILVGRIQKVISASRVVIDPMWRVA